MTGAAGRALPVTLAAGIILASASGYPVGTIGVRGAPPFLLTAVRIWLAAALLTAFALGVRARWPRGRLLGHTVVVGLLGHGLHFAGLYAGLAAGVPAATSALLFGLSPVLSAALATGVVGERLGPARLLGLALGVAAVVAAVGGPMGHHVDRGTVLTLLGLVGLASSTVWQQRFCSSVDLRSAGAVQLTASAFALTALAAFEPGHVSKPGTTVLVVLWLVGVNSIAGTMMILSAVRIAGAARATTVFAAVPSAAAVMAWPLLGQVPPVRVLVGLVLGAAAVVLGTRSWSRSGDSVGETELLSAGGGGGLPATPATQQRTSDGGRRSPVCGSGGLRRRHRWMAGH